MLTTRHYPHSPAVRRAATDRHLLPLLAELQQQRQTDGRTDGQTPDKCIDPATKTLIICRRLELNYSEIIRAKLAK